MSGQSKAGSAVETLTNTVVGFGLNYLANLVVLPYFFGHSIGLALNFYMGLVYTVISVVRGYALRRFFNGPLHRFTQRLFPVWRY
jgi:hypothetical protein